LLAMSRFSPSEALEGMSLGAFPCPLEQQDWSQLVQEKGTMSSTFVSKS
jgi:hypothetical protein